MKICSRCGYNNTDDSCFCENCGNKLEIPQIKPKLVKSEPVQQEATYQEPEQQRPVGKKKNGLVAAIIAIAVLLILVVGVLVWGYIMRNNSGGTQVETSGQTEYNTRDEDNQKTEESTEKQQAEQSSEGQNTEPATQAMQAETEAKESEVDYSDADINAVDNAYIQIKGLIEIKNNLYVLTMPSAVTVAFYNADGAIEKKEGITEFIFENQNEAEYYLGAEVSVKGKLHVNEDEKLLLQVVKQVVEKEAQPEEDTEYHTHTYELIVEDVTWQEAFEECKNRGGYLVQINSPDEFHTLLDFIEEEGAGEVHFYLGGRREPEGREYFWVNEENLLTGEPLNPASDSWAADYWMENEPSYVAGDSEEMYMNLIYYKDNWVLNDVPDDITIYYPGKTGYICEYSN